MKTLFAIYFIIGLLLMVVAIASRGKERRMKPFQVFTFGVGDGPDAALLIFIALLWPIWLFTSLLKDDPES